MANLFRHSYNWTMDLAGSRFSQLFIFLSFFLDACIFPFPTTIIFITVCLIRPSRSYFNALIATFGMLTGSLIGYALGHYLWLLPDGSFTRLALYLFKHVPGFTINHYHYIQNLYQNWGYNLLLFSVVLPIPYQLYSITAGVFDFNLLLFTFLTLIFQGSRFFIIAWLTVRLGEGVKQLFRKNLKIIVILCLIIVLIITFTLFLGFRFL